MPDPVSVPASSTSSSSSSITSGTASASLVKAAQASVTGTSAPAASAGDTPIPGGAGDAPKPDANAQVPPKTATPADAKPGADGSPAATPPAVDATQHKALTDARDQGRRDVRREFGLKQSWKPQHIREGMGLYEEFNKDPQQFYSNLTEWMVKNGYLKPGQSPTATATAPAATGKPFSLPKPMYTAPDGSKFFSAEQMSEVVTQLLSEVDARMDARVQPMQKTVAQVEQERKDIAARAEVSAQGDALIALMEQRPGFKENRKAIGAIMEQLSDEDFVALGGTHGALMWAYNEWVNTVHIPSITASAEQRVRDENAKKANASRGNASPSTTVAAPPPSALKNTKDLAAHMAQMAGAVGTR